jgi:hypothetical protein
VVMATTGSGRFACEDEVRAHLAAGGDEGRERARELARFPFELVAGGSFILHTAANDGVGLSHAGTGRAVGIPCAFLPRRLALRYAAALKTLRDGSGEPFDWDTPGIASRIAAYATPEVESFPAAGTELWQRVVLDPADRRKRRIEDPAAPFASVPELRAHVRQLAPDGVPTRTPTVQERRRIAEDPALDLSPSGRLLLWREAPRRWRIAGAASAFDVTSIVATQDVASEFATWLECRMLDRDGVPFPFGSLDAPARATSWVSGEGATFDEAVMLVRGDFDQARGCDDELFVRMARRTRQALERSRQRLRPRDSSGVPMIGELITVSGTLVGHAEERDLGVWLPLDVGHVRWGGRYTGGRILDDGSGPYSSSRACWWLFYRWANDPWPTMFRQRDPHIAEATPSRWTTAKAEELARAYGVTDEQLAALKSVAEPLLPRGEQWESRCGFARRLAADLFGAPKSDLDRVPMEVLAVLDECSAQGRLGDLASLGEVGGADLAARLFTVAAERARRGLGFPDDEYLDAREIATTLRDRTAGVTELSGPQWRAALDYARARVDAATRWPSSDPGSEPPDAWRAVVTALR